MKQLGDITKLVGSSIPLVDVVVGGSPCQDLSMAGKRTGLCGERSSLFLEQIRLVKEMRAEAKKQGKIGYAVQPRFMLWENVPGAFSSNNGADFRVILEEIAHIVDTAVVIPMPYKNKWALAGAIYGNNWSIAWRTLDAQYWGVPQRRRRIALVVDFAGATAGDVLFEYSSSLNEVIPPPKKNTHTCLTAWDCQSKRIHSCDGILPTLQGGIGGGVNNPAIFVPKRSNGAEDSIEYKAIRRVTPTECCRLQDYPDDWCDIADWEDERGRVHKTTDAVKYRALGNSLALPQWRFVLSNIAHLLTNGATIGSLFDGLGGFLLIWSQLNGLESCLWASEIEPYPIAVSKYHFGG